jgi:hypothetical protein
VNADDMMTALTQQMLIEKRTQMRRQQQQALRRHQAAELKRMSDEAAAAKAIINQNDHKGSDGQVTTNDSSGSGSATATTAAADSAAAEAAKAELLRVERETEALRHRHEEAARQLAAQQAEEDAKLSQSLGVRVPDISAADTLLDSFEVNVTGDNRSSIMSTMNDVTSAAAQSLMQQMITKKRNEARAAQMAALKAKQAAALVAANQRAIELKQQAEHTVMLTTPFTYSHPPTPHSSSPYIDYCSLSSAHLH